jgi:hypothetical protein
VEVAFRLEADGDAGGNAICASVRMRPALATPFSTMPAAGHSAVWPAVPHFTVAQPVSGKDYQPPTYSSDEI